MPLAKYRDFWQLPTMGSRSTLQTRDKLQPRTDVQRAPGVDSTDFGLLLSLCELNLGVNALSLCRPLLLVLLMSAECVDS